MSEYPGPAGSDVYVARDGSRRMDIHAVAIDPDVKLDGWALRNIEQRVTWSNRRGAADMGCGCGNDPGSVAHPRAPAFFDDRTIDSRPAVVRSECGFVDAVIHMGDRALVIELGDQDGGLGGDVTLFDELAGTVRIIR